MIARSACHLVTSSLTLPSLLLFLAVPVSAQRAAEPPPTIFSAVVDSIIQPVSADFMVQTIERANRTGASAIVFTLRTPGGLVEATREIVSAMIESRAPVVVFVGPSGGRAASAGFLLTIAADVAAMAPGTHIGAAHPVTGSGGQPPDASLAKKMEEDVAAYARTLAQARGRNVDLAADAVRSSRAFTETEALSASPPLIDIVATDLPDLVGQLDGRTVRRFDGTGAVLHLQGARVIPVEMTLRQRVLSAIANPNIAYLLLSLGTLGLAIELWTPGAIVPGVVGSMSLLLAFFALQILPVNVTGLLLLVLGLGLLVLELKFTSYGLLTVGGLVCLTLGSMMLFDSERPELRVSVSVIIPVVVGLTVVFAGVIRLAVTSQRRPAVSGPAGMVGAAGEALSDIAPGSVGQIRAHGEIWRAVAATAIPRGARVRVESVDGLTMTVHQES